MNESFTKSLLSLHNSTIQEIDSSTDTIELDDLSSNTLQWIKESRPYVGGIKRTFEWEPFMIPLLEDPSPNIIGLQARQCIEENEYVYTPSGITKTKYLKDGDKILGGTISQIHSFEDELYEIRFFNGTHIKVNDEHPFYTETGWKKAKELTTKDNVEFIDPPDTFDTITWGKDFSKLMGYLHSDGHYSEKQSVSFANTNKSFTEEVIELTKKTWPQLNPIIKKQQQYEQYKPAYWTWLIVKHGANKNPLIDFIRKNNLMGDSFGIIPSLQNSDLIAFIQGYFNGDGYLWHNKAINRVNQYRTEIGFSVGIHEKRAYEFQYMLWRLGIGSIVKKEWMKKSTRPFYRVLTTRHEDVLKLLSLLDKSKYPEKFENCEKNLHMQHRTVRIKRKDNSQWVGVRKITKCEKGTVIGFAVSPTHEIYSYLGMRTHNTFKSTTACDLIGCFSTSHKDEEVTYVVDRDSRARVWSVDRFRKDTLKKNTQLAAFLPAHGRAAVNEIRLLNGTIVYVRTDQDEYNNVQGMSNGLMVYDECQFQDLQYRSYALYTMTQKKGRVYYFGVGGELGSEWHKMWKRSDQKEWVFDDKNWRDKLKFDESGYLCNEHPENIVSGKWVAQEPNNKEYSGYHMSQLMFARIPLTIKSALEEYRTIPENAIEYKQKYDYSSTVTSHVYADFYKAMRRPITPEMVENCWDKSLSLLTAEQTRALKSLHKEGISIFLGIDWGSGESASSTVGAVVIYWKKTNRVQLANIFVDPCKEELEEPGFFLKVFRDYACDQCVADLGYGKDKVESMQKGGYTPKGEKFIGLGVNKIMGCWSSGNLTEEAGTQQQDTKFEQPKRVTIKAHYTVDKTEIIQHFIDMLGTTVPDESGNHQLSKFIIPAADDSKILFLTDDFCRTTRHDLAEDNEIEEEDGRQKAKKEFNHPKDSMMSIIYTMVANDKYDPKGFMPSVINYKH